MSLGRKVKETVRTARSQGPLSAFNSVCCELLTVRRLPERLAVRPVFAQIEITNACNLRCRMCAHASDHWLTVVPRRSMNMDEFRRLIGMLPCVRSVLKNGMPPCCAVCPLHSCYEGR